MGRRGRMILILGAVLGILWGMGIARDLRSLRTDVLRLHVVADSDSEADQRIKLRVRDAVLAEVGQEEFQNEAQAERALRAKLPRLEQAANRVLRQEGTADRACVTLEREAFPVRHYDTFSLPSGIYRSLRVTIGSGEGHNWWCVIFPRLCSPEKGENAAQSARKAGFSEELTGAVSGEYEIRFWVLDQIGKLGNFLESARN